MFWLMVSLACWGMLSSKSLNCCPVSVEPGAMFWLPVTPDPGVTEGIPPIGFMEPMAGGMYGMYPGDVTVVGAGT